MKEESKAKMNFTESYQDENDFSEGIEKMTDVLNEAEDKLYELADSLEVTDEELEEIKAGDAGKTREEIDEEDELAAQIAAPIVDTLDAATAEIYGMTEKVLEMTGDFLDHLFAEKD
jgi:Ni,Fe-hydrogenase III large subunit